MSTSFIKIAISGLHCQGKTTLIKDLISTPLFQDKKDTWVVYDSPSRLIAKEQGVGKINENGDGYTQLCIMHKHLSNLKESRYNSIFDRSALDGFAYSRSLYNNMSADYFNMIKNYFLMTMPLYDMLVYIEPELELKSDGVRSVNREFFEETKRGFDSILKEYRSLLPRSTLRVGGSREERVKCIVDYIHKQQQ